MSGLLWFAVCWLASAQDIRTSQLSSHKNLYRRFSTTNQSKQDRAFAQSSALSEWFSSHFPRDPRGYIMGAFDKPHSCQEADWPIKQQSIPYSKKYVFSRPHYTLHNIFIGRIQADEYAEVLHEVGAQLQKDPNLHHKIDKGRAHLPIRCKLMVSDQLKAWGKVVSTTRLTKDLQEFVAMQRSPLPTCVLAIISSYLGVVKNGVEAQNSESLFGLLDDYPIEIVADGCDLPSDQGIYKVGYAPNPSFLSGHVPLPTREDLARVLGARKVEEWKKANATTCCVVV